MPKRNRQRLTLGTTHGSSLADIVGGHAVSLYRDMSSEYARENWHWREGSTGAGAAVIFDIDGVLADAAGRQHYLDWGDWKRFFDACGDDPIIEEIERLLELLDSSLKVVLLTGRPRRVQPHTVAWLERYGLRWDVLIMRDYGDYSGFDEFKRGALRDLVKE